MVAIQNIVVIAAAGVAFVQATTMTKQILRRDDDLSIRGTNNVFDRRDAAVDAAFEGFMEAIQKEGKLFITSCISHRIA